VDVRAGLTADGSLRKDEDVESTPGNLGQIVLAPGDTYRFALVSSSRTPRVMSDGDTAFFWVRCFYTGAETRKRYYSEKMYRKFGLHPFDRPDGDHVWIMNEDAEDMRTQTMGRIVADRAVPDE